jgi:peptidyl-prolyl cis-trans isomerase D
MLNKFRESLKESKVLHWVLGAVGVGLVAYLGFDFTNANQGGANPNAWVATVNGTEIPGDVFLRVAQNQDSFYRGIYGEQYDQIRAQMQLGRSSAMQLVSQEIMLQEATRAGLGASESEVRRRILDNASFRDANGDFVGKETYTRILSRQRGGVALFEKQLSDQIIVEKWQEMLTATASVSHAEVDKLFRSRNIKTVVDYVIVASADMDLDENVTDAELQNWYDDHSDDYMQAEGRKISYTVVNRSSVLESIQLTEEELKNYYESNSAAYTRDEQRRASHILFKVEPDADTDTRAGVKKLAEDTLTRVQAGEDFAAIARSLSQDPISAQRGGDLDWFGRGRMVPTFDQAVFGTAIGELAPLVETDFGYHVLKVTDERAAGQIPFEDLRDDIENTLKLTRAQQEVEATADRLAASITDAASLRSETESIGGTVSEAVVRPGGRIPDLGQAAQLTQRVFETTVGESTGPVGISEGIVIAVVEEEIDRSVSPFEEVSGRVRADLLNRRLRDAAEAAARAAYDKGGDLKAIATRLGTEIRDSGDLAPGEAPAGSGGSTAQMESELFADSAEIGATGMLNVPGGTMIYTITDRVPFDEAAFRAIKPTLEQELLGQRKGLLLQQILNDLLKSYEVKLNEEMIARIDQT